MHNAFMSEMSERLVKARIEKGIDGAAEAARRLRVRYQTYAAHENGSRGLNRRAKLYAAFYGVRVEWLLYGIPPMRELEKPVPMQIFETLPPADQEEWLRFGVFLQQRRRE